MRFLARGSALLSGAADTSDPLTRGLELWLPLTERGGLSVLQDGLRRPIQAGIWTGTPSWQAWAIDGPNGSAVNTANTGYVNVTNNVGWNCPSGGPLTLAIWVNMRSTNYKDSALIGKTNYNIPAPWDWYMKQVKNSQTIFLGDGTRYCFSNGFEYQIPIGQWAHLAVTVDLPDVTAATARFYFNGMDGGSNAFTNNTGFTFPTDAGHDLRIGNRDDNGTQADASYSDARVYSRALTPGEIMMLYTDGLRPWMAKRRSAVPTPAAGTPAYRARVVRWGRVR